MKNEKEKKEGKSKTAKPTKKKNTITKNGKSRGVKNAYPVPTPEQFRSLMAKTGGNLTKSASILGVNRTILYRWISEDASGELQSIVDEARANLFDSCLASATALALGIPEYDEKGHFVGWRERPDAGMLRYLLGTFGKREGFADESNIKINGDIKIGIDISKWIDRELE